MGKLSHEVCASRLHAMSTRGIRPSLVAFTHALHDLSLENPNYKRILVAGTNGKGSTCAMIAEAFCRAGLKVGLLTSPHLVDVRERIQINGEKIAKETFTVLFNELEAVFERHRLTYYEALVLMGLCFFAHEKIDVAVLEVGLGGRWDATNAIDPHFTAITTVSYDHQSYLGSTLAEIAREKVAIARPGVVMVSGVGEVFEARDVIFDYCHKIGATYIERRTSSPSPLRATKGSLRGREGWGEGEIPTLKYLPGEHQERNAWVAYTLLKEFQKQEPRLTDLHIEEGIREARNPGRLQRILESPPVFLDGAHNIEGMHALRAFVEQAYPGKKAVLLFCVMKDKDYPEMIADFSEWVAHVYFIPLDEARALEFSTFARVCPVPCESLVLDAVRPEFFRSFTSDQPVVICGSLYLVGAVLKQWEAGRLPLP